MVLAAQFLVGHAVAFDVEHPSPAELAPPPAEVYGVPAVAEDAPVPPPVRAHLPPLPSAAASAVLVQVAEVAKEVESHVNAKGVYSPHAYCGVEPVDLEGPSSQLEGMRCGMRPWTWMGT